MVWHPIKMRKSSIVVMVDVCVEHVTGLWTLCTISRGGAKSGVLGGDPQLNPLDYVCFFSSGWGKYGGIRRKSPPSCPIEGALES